MNKASAIQQSIPDPPSRSEVVRLKAGLLCEGLFPNPVAQAICQRQNPCEDWKTGNVGIHFAFETGSHVLATVDHTFNRDSGFSLESNEAHLVLLERGTAVCRVAEIAMPSWYKESTSMCGDMSGLFLHEGRAFLHQTYSGCDYYATKMQCMFCSAGPKWRIGTPSEIGEVVSRALAENPAYHVCLGGGTRVPIERNVAYFSECAEQIRKANPRVPIWVEMVPPDSDEEILRMVEAGVTSFGFNIELWDDKRRQELCPAKALVSKTRYLSAMEYALEVLGPNRVGSCLMAGLEPLQSSIRGCCVLASIGVQPCVLPFKPWDGSDHAAEGCCTPNNLVEISRSAVRAMIANGVSPAENQGCLRCDACTIDHDVYELEVESNGGNAHAHSGS